MSGVMDSVDAVSDIMDGMRTALESLPASPFNSVGIFPGTREDKLFDYAEAAPLPSATIIYRGSSFKQGNPPRAVDAAVVVVSEMGEGQGAVWELVEAVASALDNVRVTKSGDALCFAKRDRGMDIGGAAACAAIDFEIKCY
jgi:hypothetical protein